MRTDNDRSLDERIRALVATALADAPDAPDLAPDTVGVVLRPTRRVVPWAVAGVAAAAAVVLLVAAVVTREPDRRIAAVPSTTEAAAVAAWPQGVVVLLASERGVERVSAEGGQVVVQRTAFNAPAELALELSDGSVVYQQARELGDYGVIELVGPSGDGGPVADLATTTLLDADYVDGRVRILYSTPAAGREPQIRRVWLWVDGEATVWNDVFASVERQFRLGADEPALAEPPAAIADLAADATHIDVHDGFAAVSFADGPGVLVDLRAGVRYLLPAGGIATIARRSISNRPVEPPPSTVAEPPDATTLGLLLAGPDGVWELGPDDGAHVTTEPMAIALRAPDGSIVMQRQSGWGEGWTQGDTVPLVWRSGGVIEELLPGVDWANDVWIRLHDIAEVDGTTWLLYEVQHTQPWLASQPGSLVALDLGAGTPMVLDDVFGGFERPTHRFTINASGTVVGALDEPECVTMLSYVLPGSTAPLPESEGFQTACARAVTADRSGDLLAWIEGSELVVANWAEGRELHRIDLGAEADIVSGLALGDGYAVVDRIVLNGPQRPPLLVRFAGGVVETSELAALTATIP